MKFDTLFLIHILDEIEFVLLATNGKSLKELQEDGMLQRACSRSIEIIGEAAKNISPSLKNKNRNIPWKQLSGMRDKLIHHYFGVNWVIVWDVIENHLPGLKVKIADLIAFSKVP